MKPKTIAVLACVAAASATAFAQSSFFSEVLEVRVTNVDVVVTDKGGKPVHGLTRDDFELYELGQKREISNFLEIQEGPEAALDASDAAAPRDNRRRQIAAFIDDAALHPLRRNLVLEHMGRFLDATLRPGDEVMLVASAETVKLELEPTSDHAKVTEALGHLAKHTTRSYDIERDRERFHRALVDLIDMYGSRSPPEKPPLSLGIYEARSFAMLAEHRMRQRAGALKSVIASLRGAPGRKILIYVSEGFSSNPGEEAFRYVDAIREKFAADGSHALHEMKEFELPSLIMDVAEAANSSGVTLYAIDSSGAGGSFIVPDASQAVRVTPDGASVTGVTLSALGAIAAETGGAALVNSTNYKVAFDTIARDLSSYYSLGFRSTGERQDALRTIEVKLKKKGYTVRTRRAVIEPSIDSEMNDAVSAHLFRAIAQNDLEVKAMAGPRATVSGSDQATIPVTITIPMSKLTLLPEGTDLKGSFSIFAAFLRMDGQVSKVARQQKSFRFPAASLPNRKEITVKLDVTADPRTDGVSIGVMDDATRATGFAAVKVQ